MILPCVRFKVRLTEKPVIIVKDEKTGKDEPRDWGHFVVGKKYEVLSLYDDGQHPTAVLLADETREFRWISINICRRA
jgi:hypothetical protein